MVAGGSEPERDARWPVVRRTDVITRVRFGAPDGHGPRLSSSAPHETKRRPRVPIARTLDLHQIAGSRRVRPRVPDGGVLLATAAGPFTQELRICRIAGPARGRQLCPIDLHKSSPYSRRDQRDRIRHQFEVVLARLIPPTVGRNPGVVLTARNDIQFWESDPRPRSDSLFHPPRGPRRRMGMVFVAGVHPRSMSRQSGGAARAVPFNSQRPISSDLSSMARTCLGKDTLDPLLDLATHS